MALLFGIVLEGKKILCLLTKYSSSAKDVYPFQNHPLILHLSKIQFFPNKTYMYSEFRESLIKPQYFVCTDTLE